MNNIDYSSVIHIYYSTKHNRYKFTTTNGHITRYAQDNFRAIETVMESNGLIKFDTCKWANLSHIRSIVDGHATFSNGERLPIARVLEEKVVEAYNREMNTNEND